MSKITMYMGWNEGPSAKRQREKERSMAEEMGHGWEPECLVLGAWCRSVQIPCDLWPGLCSLSLYFLDKWMSPAWEVLRQGFLLFFFFP